MLQQRTLQHRIHHLQNKCSLHILKNSKRQFFFWAENKSKCSHLKISSQNKGKRSCPPRK